VNNPLIISACSSTVARELGLPLVPYFLVHIRAVPETNETKMSPNFFLIPTNLSFLFKIWIPLSYVLTWFSLYTRVLVYPCEPQDPIIFTNQPFSFFRAYPLFCCFWNSPQTRFYVQIMCKYGLAV